MCRFFTDKGMADGRHGCVDMCPIGHNSACGDIEAATDRDIEDAAKAIEKWAEENPEPVYPTWGEWLCDIGELTGCGDAKEAMRRLFSDAIPAELAEKLEIEPKT